jgi:hypothetical protein
MIMEWGVGRVVNAAQTILPAASRSSPSAATIR